MTNNEHLMYDCHFYSHDLHKYSEVKMHFLPRVGDVIQNSGYIYQVNLVEYGFGLNVYNIYTTTLGDTSKHQEIIKTLLSTHKHS